MNEHFLPKRSLLIIAILTIGLQSFAQTLISQEEVAEVDVPFEYVKWHYHYYPGSVTEQWTRSNYLNGEPVLEVRFNLDGTDYFVSYTEPKVRLTEVKQLDKNELNELIIKHLSDKYEKIKVEDYRRISEYTDRTTYIIKYRVLMKSDEVYWYDQYFINIDPNQLASY